LIAFVFPVFEFTVGIRYDFIILGGGCLLAFIALIFFLEETKGVEGKKLAALYDADGSSGVKDIEEDKQPLNKKEEENKEKEVADDKKE